MANQIVSLVDLILLFVSNAYNYLREHFGLIDPLVACFDGLICLTNKRNCFQCIGDTVNNVMTIMTATNILLW